MCYHDNTDVFLLIECQVSVTDMNDMQYTVTVV